MKRYLCIFFALAATAAAQTAGGLATPTLGYVFDANAGSLRAIEGVPGAAVLGDALHLGSPDEGSPQFASIAVSTNRRYALATRAGEGQFTLLKLDGRSGSASRSLMPAGKVWFSPSASALAIAAGDHVEIWTGLPDAPALLHTLTAAMTVDKAAVSDNGREVVVLSSGTLYRLGEESTALGSGIADAAFLRGTQDVVALSASEATVYRKSEGTNAEPLVANGGQALMFSRDERSLALLSDDTVTWVDLATLASVTLSIDRAGQLARAEGNAVFQLTDGAGGLWLLDADASSPRLLPIEARNEVQAQ